MLYRVEFKKSAHKEYLRLPEKMRLRVGEALQVLAANPSSLLLDVKKLKGAVGLFRFRLGDYRVVYELHSSVLVVVIIKIGHRSDVYR